MSLITPPSPDEEAHLNSMPSGSEDWAVEAAERHLTYLWRCKTEADRIEYLAAALRLVENQGAGRMLREIQATLGTKQS